jgi:hypothetical protein
MSTLALPDATRAAVRRSRSMAALLPRMVGSETAWELALGELVVVDMWWCQSRAAPSDLVSRVMVRH